MLKVISIISLSILFAVCGIIGYFIVYHLRRFGIHGDKAQKMIAVFIAVSIGLAAAALIFFYRVPWENFSVPTY